MCFTPRITKVCKNCGHSVTHWEEKKYGEVWNCEICNYPLTSVNYFLGKKIGGSCGDGRARLIEELFQIKISEENHNLRKNYYEDREAKSNLELQKQREAASKEWDRKFREQLNNVPKCPTCGSTSISNISTLDRAVSVGTVGLASGKIGKTRKCNSCGYMW